VRTWVAIVAKPLNIPFHSHVQMRSSVGVPLRMLSKDAVIALMDADSKVNGYAAMV
jgi:hypothetical protein